MNCIIDGIDVIIGMDVINEMGGVTIKEEEVKFEDVHCAVATHRLNVCKIEDCRIFVDSRRVSQNYL